MSKPIWFPFYANDFLSSSKVALLTTEEIGAYVLLLCHAWQDPQCSLPDNDEDLAKLGRIKGDMTTLRACFRVKKHRLINERLYKEWENVKEKSELAKRSIAIRWENKRNTNVLPTKYSSQSYSQSQLDEEKNKNMVAMNGSHKPKGKRQISDLDTMTDKHREFAKSLGVDPGPEWGKFKNYCLAHGKQYVNFEAAFRNWLANSVTMNGGKRVL